MAVAKSRKRARAPHRWQKGESGNPAGRAPGTPNRATTESKAFCQALFRRPKYQRRIIAAWDNGTLPADIEKVLLYYGFGKPPTAIDLGITGFDHARYLAGEDAGDT